MELLACLYHRGKKFLEDYESPGISCKAQFRPKPWTLLPLHKTPTYAVSRRKELSCIPVLHEVHIPSAPWQW